MLYENYFVGIIDGSKTKDKDSFLTEIANAFNFPGYYGHNLDALWECIRDLEWIEKENYILIIKHGDDFLSNEPMKTRTDIIKLLQDVCLDWSDPTIQGNDQIRRKADFRVYLD